MVKILDKALKYFLRYYSKIIFSLVPIIVIIFRMEQELFEVNQKIHQIEDTLGRRRQKSSEWNPHYKKVLEEKIDKKVYLQKSYPKRKLLQTLKHKQNTPFKGIIKKELNFEIKNRKHFNDLKELDILHKHKQRIRIINRRKQEENYKLQKQRKLEKNNKNIVVKEIENIQNLKTEQYCERNIKDRINPFAQTKGDKFVEIYHNFKNDHDHEKLAPKMMRHFGVGLQNTPLGSTITKKDQKNQQRTNNFRLNPYKTKTCNFVQEFTKTFKKTQKAFNKIKPQKMFENKIRSIIKQHGGFWNQQLQRK